MNENTLKNCRILIKNIEDGKVVADTKIIRFKSRTNSVFISEDSLAEKKYYNISAYVFKDGNLYESLGTIKGAVVNHEVEVFLGKSREKEDRSKTRYPMETEGNIDGVIIGGKLIPLRKYMVIHTINMSASGILIRADVGCFDVGDSFSLILGSEEKGMEMSCEVVRIQNSGMLTEEYGCRIMEIRRNSGDIGQEKAE